MPKHLTAAETAKARFLKREEILNPRPIHLTAYGWFILGLTAGAVFMALVTLVMRITGTFSGIMLIIGVVTILAVIGVNMKDDENE
jgi:hypothetical protein